MGLGNVSRVVLTVLQRPHLRRFATINAARLAIHPFERRWPSGRSLPPRSLQVMVTDTCNFNCRMCQFAFSASPGFRLRQFGLMPREVFRRMLETTPGRPLVAITGGEPLLHPELPAFIRLSRERGHPCSVTTNGWFLEDRAAALAECGLDALVVSIDGGQGSHDEVRGEGAFVRAVGGIQKVLDMPSRPFVAISCVVNDLNAASLEKIHEVAVSLHVDALNFNHLWIQSDLMVAKQRMLGNLPEANTVGWQLQLGGIDPARVFHSIQSVKQRQGSLAINEYPNLSEQETEVYYREPDRLVKERDTRCAWLQAKIWPNGDVRMCREASAGNVMREPLRVIWNNQRYRSFRRYLSRAGSCPICSRCCYFFMRV